ncbi:hypothetical protein SY91_05698 [Burkholderia cenocepacia]|uniref:DUF1330 domain-containing protein n=1 Tax=Burkholderia cenocepacia TaxID=95486 RepID=UPI0003C46F13|nr:DUF1330 domain-containing protein [Burkholderia cenocepacia]ESS40635.1 hypothetical protein P355_2404 [Burkholderia cenocepacia KC-01]QND98241.1 hypothetical protein SY91_05698 [Burkholderia cenocepacia]
MTAYAIAHLHDVEMCDDIVEYLERIDGTLAPYDGHFVIHGARPEVREGAWHGDLIAIAFPDLDMVRAWYDSDAYRQIQPLRARHASGPLILIDGVDERHKATDILR